MRMHNIAIQINKQDGKHWWQPCFTKIALKQSLPFLHLHVYGFLDSSSLCYVRQFRSFESKRQSFAFSERIIPVQIV